MPTPKTKKPALMDVIGTLQKTAETQTKIIAEMQQTLARQQQQLDQLLGTESADEPEAAVRESTNAQFHADLQYVARIKYRFDLNLVEDHTASACTAVFESKLDFARFRGWLERHSFGFTIVNVADRCVRFMASGVIAYLGRLDKLGKWKERMTYGKLNMFSFDVARVGSTVTFTTSDPIQHKYLRTLLQDEFDLTDDVSVSILTSRWVLRCYADQLDALDWLPPVEDAHVVTVYKDQLFARLRDAYPGATFEALATMVTRMEVNSETPR